VNLKEYNPVERANKDQMANTIHFVSAVLFASISLIYFITPVSSVMAADGIHLVNFNQTFYLANETYIFQLFPLYYVPRSLIRHIIYTGTLNSTITFGKRALMEYSHSQIELAEDDHALLTEFLNGDVPSFVKANSKKRSLPLVDGDIRIIQITPKATLITSGFKQSKKRGLSQLGTEVCLHVPFFTTCDNSADLNSVKTALTAAVDEIHSELDSYEATNNARVNALSSALNTQRNIISSMLSNLQQTGTLVAQVASSVQVNAAQIADGDFQAMSQIDYLKRVTNSLLKYSNAMASTDPRAVVAQPSMSKLFAGFISVMQTLKSTGYIPIVDSDNSTAFTWQEIILPAQSVQNSSAAPCLNDSQCNYQSGYMTTGNFPVPSFSAIFALSCSTTNGYPDVPACVAPAVVQVKTSGWIYGPFHKSHYGIFTVEVALSSSSSVSAYVMQPINQPVRSGSILSTSALPVAPTADAYCVQFLGYTMFSSQPSALGLVNGYSSTTDDSNCDVLRLVNGNGLTTTIYSLYAELQGIVVPFYSNCDLVPLQNDLYSISPSEASIISTMNYVCSNAWTQYAQGSNTSSACSNIAMSLANTDVYLYHWVSPTCYINIEPGWMDLDYWVDPPLATIPNIPRGFQLNQFTINPAGELSSSLEFVYTDQWLTVYSVQRISDNRLLTDEITVLDGSVVLFYLDTDGVIDESDSFFGEGNNGRNCIQLAPSYDYNLLNCFFQNDNTLYTPSQYVTGIVVTTGIARYNDKFDFTLVAGVPNETISFSLVPNQYSDFSYSVEMDGNLCPQFLNQQTYTSGCIISLYYAGTEQIEIAPTSTTDASIITTFPVPEARNFSIGIDTWTVSAGNKECFILQCQYSVTFNVVKLTTPNVQLISASDLALQTTMQLSIGVTLKNTIDSMNNVMEQVSQANKNLSALQQTLDALNFNVSQLYPYQNFTTMRNQLNALIDSLGSPSSDNSAPAQNCDGPWNSVQCWFQSFASVLIYIAICVAIVIIGYVVCIRMGVAKKLFGKLKKPSSSDVDAGTTTQLSEYRAD